MTVAGEVKVMGTQEGTTFSKDLFVFVMSHFHTYYYPFVRLMTYLMLINVWFAGRGRQRDNCMFLLYINANSVTNSKGNKSGRGREATETPGSGLAMEFTVKELYAIQEIQSETHLFRLIVGCALFSLYF